MAKDHWANVSRGLRKLAAASSGIALTDAQLLESFLAHGDNAAFETLVARYGPMVLGLCRRVLRHSHDSEDAFQATFLVLVRKAGALKRRESVGNWLYGVAYRTAMQARTRKKRREFKEGEIQSLAQVESPVDAASRPEMQALLDQELSKLPDIYREPVVLCDLLGKSKRQAAKELGCPEGTVSSRLARGRDMLRKRLARHSTDFAVGTGALAVTQNTAQAVPAALATATIKAAESIAAGQASAVLAPGVAALTDGVLKSMLLRKLFVMAGIFVVLFAATATGLVAYSSGTGELQISAGEPKQRDLADQGEPGKQTAAKARDLYGDPLPDGAAMRLGTVQLRAPGSQLVLSADGKTLIGVREGKFVSTWDAASGKLLATREFPTSVAQHVDLSPDGKWLVNGLDVCDIETGKVQVKLVYTEPKLFLLQKSISRDGVWYAGVSSDSKKTPRGERRRPKLHRRCVGPRDGKANLHTGVDRRRRSPVGLLQSRQQERDRRLWDRSVGAGLLLGPGKWQPPLAKDEFEQLVPVGPLFARRLRFLVVRACPRCGNRASCRWPEISRCRIRQGGNR
jgi:RNA polymerase sigma factor (sigma-70 family)